MNDTSTSEGRDTRLQQKVERYSRRRNWPTVVRLIGGSPRHDMQDYSDADAGEAPQGARW